MRGIKFRDDKLIGQQKWKQRYYHTAKIRPVSAAKRLAREAENNANEIRRKSVILRRGG